MAWQAGVTRATGDIITSANWNGYLGAGGDVDLLSTHAHSGAAGDGSASIGPLTQGDFSDQGSDPAAPGASKARLYSKSGVLYRRSGAAGSATAVLDVATAFDATAPSTQAFGDAAAAGSAEIAARRDHKHGMPSPADAVIAETLLAVATGTISFTSIPNTYRHLLLVFHGKGATSDTDTVLVQFNGDSTTTYSWQHLTASGASVTGSRSTGQTSISLNYAGGDLELWIPAYALTSHIKGLKVNGLYRNAGGLDIEDASGVWSSTAAITQIDLICGSSHNFDVGTVATLYGLGHP